VRIGSVIGRTFPCEVVKQIYPHPITDIELVHRFDDLTGLGLILLEKEGPSPEYSFKHILTQEVAYDSTPFAWRREVHQKVAGYFEKRFAESIEAYYELLCHHYSKANNKQKTLEYSAKSGDKAKRIFANQEAVRYYHNALEVAPAVTGSNLLANKIRENLGDICELTGQYDRAIETYQAGQQGYVTLRRMLNLRIKNRASTLEGLAVDLPSIQDIDRRIAILYGKRGMAYERKGEYSTALHWLDKGLARLPEECEDLAHLYTDRAGVLYRLGRHSEALDWCQRGLHIAQNTNDLSSIAHLSYLLGTIHADLGNIQQAIDLRLESLRIYQSIDHLPGQAVVHNNLGVAFYYRGDWKTCRQHYEEGLALYTRIGDVQGMAMVSNNIGEVLSDQGEFDEAIKAFRRCLETWSGIGYSIGVVISHNNLGRAYTRAGQWQIAVDHLNQSINLIEKMETRGILAAEAYQRLAETHLCAGDPRLTLQLCEQSLSFAEQAQLAVVEGVTRRVMGQAYRYSKQWDKAKESLLCSERILRERGVIHELCQTLWELVLLDYDCDMDGADLGHVAPVGPKQQLEEAVAIFQKLGVKYDIDKAAELKALYGSAS
jgi:tetratricopeptide (TPR) repeat protein